MMMIILAPSCAVLEKKPTVVKERAFVSRFRVHSVLPQSSSHYFQKSLYFSKAGILVPDFMGNPGLDVLSASLKVAELKSTKARTETQRF